MNIEARGLSATKSGRRPAPGVASETGAGSNE